MNRTRLAPSVVRTHRVHAWPIFAMSLAGLIAGAARSAAAAPALPTGGQVQAGSAIIATSTGFSLTINQSSTRAVIDWTSFSIGAGGKVQFNNGSGVTLNRVTGGLGSEIDGLLTATGGVYLLNPNGVIIGPNGVVSVGGSFVASTLDLTNSQFMSGGDLTFSGSGGGSVINEGAIDAAGGDAVLIGATVENDGQIRAPKGTAGLAAGHQVMLRDQAQNDGKISVLLGGAGTSATNTGLIAAANAELRANGGNVYALAVNTGSQIEVTGLTASDGKVFLIADGGSVIARGEIDAVNANGSGGSVETSGASVDFIGLTVRAGNWLIDPVNLTVDSAAAATISTNLATTNITLQTTASSASGPGVQSPGPGDITVTAPISWASANTLTFDAYHSVIIDADITASGPGKVVLKTNDGGTGGAYWFGSGDSLEFTDTPGSGQALTINSQPYTLVYTEADLLNINSNLAGFYALPAPLDLNGIGFGGSPIAGLLSTPFTGVFTGLGNTISHLTIIRSIATLGVGPGGYAVNGLVGLFGYVGAGGEVQSVNLDSAHVSGGDGMFVGALVGLLGGTVFNASSSGEVTVGNDVNTADGLASAIAGGLVGTLRGQVLDSSSSANVSGGQAFIGGLVGDAGAGASASIVNSYATGDVGTGDWTNTSLPHPEAGGLIGLIYGFDAANTPALVTVSGSYATGFVSGGADAAVAGFVGGVEEGQITTSYASGDVALTAPGVAGGVGGAGGFVGYLGIGGTITQSYASGAVNAVGGPNNLSDTLAGGFAGDVDLSSTITNSYALGAVTTTGSAFSVAGGFAGLVQESASVSTVYATGLVTSAGIGAGLVGLVGNPNVTDKTGSVSNSYWDEGTTGQGSGYFLGTGSATATNIIAVGDDTGISPYATATYANFDLVNTWFMIPGETRPILRSEYSTTISNAHQLQLMAMNLGADYTIAADINASETSLDSGVWNPANGFVPVGGNGAAAFTGVFNGQGHTIYNLTIIDTTPFAQIGVAGYPSNGMAGLFGYAGAGSLLENINLVNADVTGGDGMWVGALAGASSGTVKNSSSSGFITTGNETNTVNGNAYALAGGLVGGMSGSVLNSNSSATISGGDAIVGGLVGGAAHGAAITDSYATGSVTTGAANPSFNNTPAAGGLVGGANGFIFGTNTNPVPVTISGSYATGSVFGGGGANVGGFIGEITESTITTSYATGSTTETAVGPSGSDNGVGGFAGGEDVGSSITQSWASGAVSTVAGPDGSSDTFAGGFAGYLNASTISDAYSLGSVTVTGGSFSQAGGFVGQIRNGSSASNIYATGAVTGSNGGVTGGLAGQVGDANSGNTSGSISNGYWDEGTTGQTVGYNLSGTGTATNIVGIGGNTGLSPYATATYANFNLASTWYMVAGETRPILRAEYSTTITDGHQLELMALNLGASYTLANNIDLSDDTQVSGIWNPANGFVPVGGNGAAAFTGVLDGRGYTISNLTIIDTTASVTAGVNTNGLVGLIGYAGAGSLLENINLANANVTGGNGMRVGALVGFDSGELLDDTSWGTVTVGGGVSNPSFVSAAAGGLAGASNGSIIDSSSSATVTAGANAYAGGLVGSFFGSQITGSYATGDVTTGANLLPSANIITPLAGGLVGLIGNSAVVSDSYATGNVSGGAGSFIGGFVGVVQQTAMVERSYSTGSVTQTAGGQGGTNDFAGGFVGYLNGGTITQSYSSGAVNTVGGPSGLNTEAGGFAGVVDGSSFASSISNSYATGAVTVGGTAFSDAGGFVGIIEGGAAVSFVYATGQVTGSGTVGGLAGLVGNAANAGATGGTLANSYWDEGTTGQTTGYTLSGTGAVNTVVGVGGNTGISPFLAGTYAGWDFTNIWSPPSNRFYPELYFVSHVLRVTAGNVTSVYGSFPIYTLNIYGLQGGDTFDVVQGLQLAITGATTSTSGYYNAGSYGLSFSGGFTNEGDFYRLLYVNGVLTVTPLTLNVSLTGTVEKTYDGTTSATLAGGNYLLLGALAGDIVGLNDPTNGTYATQNAGSGIIVTVGGLALTGADAGNYTINVTASAPIGIIDPKAITASLIGIVEKTYDGTTSATLSGGNYQLSGVIAGDSVGLNDPTNGTYATQNAGSGIIVTVGGLVLTGASAGNYTLISVSASAPIGIIDPKAITATLIGIVEKTYDGTTSATLDSGNYALSGAIAGDSVGLNDPTAGTYATQNAGNGIIVTVGGLVLTGASAGNYTLISVSASAPIGIIDPRVLTATLIGIVEKTYDGTTSATLNGGNYQLSGVIAGDSVSLNDPTAGTYATQNAGNGIMVTVGGLVLTGASAGNYSINVSASAPIGVIDPKVLVASLVGMVSKTFDGSTTATLNDGNYVLSGVIGGDSVSLNDPTTGTYDTATPGTGKTVTVGGLALLGAAAGNYVVNDNASAAIGTINGAPPPIQTNIVVISPGVQLSSSDDPGDAADAGAPPAGVADAGSTDTGSSSTGLADAGSSDNGSSGSADAGSADAAAADAAAAAAAAEAAKSNNGPSSVFPAARGSDNDRNGIDNSPVTGGGNRDLWTGSEEGGPDCPSGKNTTPACGADQGAKP